MNGKSKQKSSSVALTKKENKGGNLFDPQVKTQKLQEIISGEYKNRK